MRVSVVMAAYQAQSTIGAAVSSVLHQSHRDLELVVVDDGCTDATAAIVAAHAAGDPRVVLVQQENRGLASARNAGLAVASGELVTMLDADDVVFDEHLSTMVALWQQHGGVVSGNSWWLFPGGVRKGAYRHKGRFPKPDEQRMALLEQNFVSVMSLFHRSVLDEVGGFADGFRQCEDWEFWLRVVFDGGHRVTLRPEPLGLYRWGVGLSADTAGMDRQVRVVVEAMAARTDLTPAERAYVDRRLAGPGPHEAEREGDDALRDGRWADARRWLDTAAELSPHETALVRKARLLRVAPPLVGRALKAREVRRAAATRMAEDARR